MIVDRFKSHTIGSHALDQPVSPSVIIDLPSAVPSANRLLYIGLRQMPLVQAKYRVRGPGESLDGHEADILRPSTEGATELIGGHTADPPSATRSTTKTTGRRFRLAAGRGVCACLKLKPHVRGADALL
jgi:hypothetical protein